MGKNKWEHANIDFVTRLQALVIRSFTAGNYLESGIMAFQLTEVALRIVIEGFARGSGINEKVIKEISNEERSVSRLITYFDMLIPDNTISERLHKLNEMRNKAMHNLLFKFSSEDHAKKELKQFCKEAITLNVELLSLLNINDSATE